VNLVMLVMNEQGLQHLLSGKFARSGEGPVAAGPVGRHASARADWKMNTEILTYSRSKGVFAGLTLEGAVAEQDDDSTRAIYGKHMMFRNIVSGKVSSPKSADAFMRPCQMRANRHGLPKQTKTKVSASGSYQLAGSAADWNRVSIPFSTAEFWMTDLVPIPALRSCALSVGGEAIRDRAVASRKRQPHCSPARQSRVPRQRKREVLPTRPPA